MMLEWDCLGYKLGKIIDLNGIEWARQFQRIKMGDETRDFTVTGDFHRMKG
jgi:hypothetical protein